MELTAAIFDLDGTLADTSGDLADSLNYALSTHGFPEADVEKVKSMVGDGVRKLICRALPDGAYTPALAEDMYAVFIKYYSEHPTAHTRAYDGIVPLLRRLKAGGVKLAAVTNKADELLGRIIPALFGDIFDIAAGLTDKYPAKPDPALTLSVMHALGASPGQCVFTGDSDTDIKTALAAGALPLGVSWGFRSRDVLLSAGAAFIADVPAEIPSLLRQAGFSSPRGEKI